MIILKLFLGKGNGKLGSRRKQFAFFVALLICNTTAYAKDTIRFGPSFCWQNSQLRSKAKDARGSFGLVSQWVFADPWHLDFEACAGSSDNADVMDKQGFDDVDASNRVGHWVNLGMGRSFFGFLSVQSGLNFLKDSASYFFVKYNDPNQMPDTKDFEAHRALLGIGGSLELHIPIGESARFFVRAGIAQYLYDLYNHEEIDQVYRPSSLGVTFGF